MGTGSILALISYSPVPPWLGHMAFRGGDEVVGGALHPLTTPQHVLVLLALALLLGLRVPLELKRPMLAFSLASAVALPVSAVLKWELSVLLLLLPAMAVAACVALDRRLPSQVVVAIAAMVGLLVALDSSPETGSIFVVAKTLIGTWIGMSAALGYAALCTTNAAEKKWARTGARVIASWIVAISLLVIAFHFRK